MFGIHRDLHSYVYGLQRLMGRTDFDRIYPSHAEISVDRNAIPGLIAGAESILAGTIILLSVPVLASLFATAMRKPSRATISIFSGLKFIRQPVRIPFFSSMLAAKTVFLIRSERSSFFISILLIYCKCINGFKVNYHYCDVLNVDPNEVCNKVRKYLYKD